MLSKKKVKGKWQYFDGETSNFVLQKYEQLKALITE